MTEKIENLYQFLAEMSKSILNERGLFALLALVLIGYLLYVDHEHTKQSIELNKQRAIFEEKLVEVQTEIVDIQRADSDVLRDFTALVTKIVEQRDRMLEEISKPQERP